MITKIDSVILFDGVCNLCNSSVQWIIAHDKKNRFKFASLQSDFGQKVLKNHGLDKQNFESFVLLEKNQIFTKSTAAIKVLTNFRGFFSLAKIFYFVPKSLRDIVYCYIANNRYKWFGKRENCWLPNPELQQRFIT